MQFIFGMLAIVGILYIVRKFDLKKQEALQEALENRVKWVESHAKLLTQIVCESSALREDSQKFITRGFNCGHDLLAKGNEDCICTKIKGRMNSMFDKNDFYTLLEEKNPTDFIEGLRVREWVIFT